MGRGSDLLIVDDACKNAEEAGSVTYRERAKEWWRSTAFTRLEPGGSVVLIMTRWHDDDLAGYLMREEPGQWDLVSLPALAESGDLLQRPEGAPLWPARYDTPALAAIRESVGPYWWSAQYQQRPQAIGGGMFHADWWKFHELVSGEDGLKLRIGEAIEPVRAIIQAWDTAFKKDQAADRSACVTLAVTQTRYAVLDCMAGRWEYPDLVRQVQAAYETWRPSKVLVEDAASGQSLTQSLRRETRLPVVAVAVTGDKVQRANTVTGTVEAGKVSLPMRAAWASEFMAELGAFPTGAHDDIVDAFVYALMASMGGTVQVFL